MRTFVAVELPDEAKRRLGAYIDKLRAALPREAKLKWVAEGNLHLTLKFVGEIEDDRAADLLAAAERAAAARRRFGFTLTALGAFPRPQRPRVLWVGLDAPGETALGKLAGAVDREVAAARLARREDRAYSAHLTIARSRAARGEPRAAELLRNAPAPPAVEVDVSEVVVMKSVLGPGGPTYTALGRFPLAPEV